MSFTLRVGRPSYRLAEEMPAGELIQRLGRDASEALDAVSQRLRKIPTDGLAGAVDRLRRTASGPLVSEDPGENASLRRGWPVMERGRMRAYVEGGPLDGQWGHEVSYSVEYPANVETFHWPEEVVWEGHLYRFKRLITGRGLGPVYEYVRTLAEDESAP